MSLKHASWGVCARTDVAHLERLAKRDLRCKSSVAAGNDGHTALFVRQGEPSFRFAQRLAVEPVVLLNFDNGRLQALTIMSSATAKPTAAPEVIREHERRS